MGIIFYAINIISPLHARWELCGFIYTGSPNCLQLSRFFLLFYSWMLSLDRGSRTVYEKHRCWASIRHNTKLVWVSLAVQHRVSTESQVDVGMKSATFPHVLPHVSVVLYCQLIYKPHLPAFKLLFFVNRSQVLRRQASRIIAFYPPYIKFWLKNTMSGLKIQQGFGAGPSAFGEAARRVSVRMPDTLNDLKRLCEQKAASSDYKLADSIKSNVPHYDLSSFSSSDSDIVCQLQDEWYEVLSSGPGVLILQNFMTDQALLNQINKVFDTIIEREAESAKGDHFATSGANSRIWNSFQKHAVQEPASFVRYYANPWLAKVSEAWLGPAYQLTAQVNVVRPSGKPQNAHRDYHLGFQSNEVCAQFPRSIQVASQYLTLQGAVAHSDMPLASGPTRLLPFSQLLPEGYMAWREPEVRAFFDENWVGAPMKAGDAVFFNPALLHAAGENTTTDVHRSANLLQISSAFGRPMEHVNNVEMIRTCWDTLKTLAADDGESDRTKACVSALAEGYPFPSNLDKQQPGANGMAPPSEADVLWEGLRKGWDTDQVITAVKQRRANSTY